MIVPPLPFDVDWLATTDGYIECWRQCTIPLFAECIDSVGAPTGALQLLGTGSFVSCFEEPFLVTASHVIRQAAPKALLATKVNGRAVLINEPLFLHSTEHDLAFMPVSLEWLFETGLSLWNHIDLAVRWDSYTPIGFWFTAGYPELGNGNRLKRNPRKIRPFGARFTEQVAGQQAGTPVPNAMRFRTDSSALYGLGARCANDFPFKGTCGAPVLQALAFEKPNGDITLDAALTGIIIEWNASALEVTVVPAEALLTFICGILEIMDAHEQLEGNH